MVRIFAVIAGGLMLGACSSMPSWMNLDGLKPGPVLDTVRFESEPSGAEAKTSTGATCRTPCALAVEASTGISVTFSLNGYRTETETLELVSMGDGTSRFRPNPVTAELTAAPPSARKPAATPKKKPAPRVTRAPAASSNASAPAESSAAAPWPTPR